MEQRISLVTLGVSDLAQSRAFYERLGWKAHPISSGSITFFQAGGIIFGLFPRAELAKDAKVEDNGSGFRGFSLAYNARTREEVDRVLDEAVAAGAALLKSAEDVSWGGYSGYFADPDGFAWDVAWNPGFPIAEDGSVTMQY